jgi:hypothetical protein
MNKQLILILLFLLILRSSMFAQSNEKNLSFINSFFLKISDSTEILTVKTYNSFFTKYDESESEFFLYYNLSQDQKEKHIKFFESENTDMKQYDNEFPEHIEYLDACYSHFKEKHPELLLSTSLMHLRSEIENRGLDLSSIEFQSKSSTIDRFFFYRFSLNTYSGEKSEIIVVLDKKDNFQISDVTDSNTKSLMSVKEFYWDKK